jgi:hypothetical protein
MPEQKKELTYGEQVNLFAGCLITFSDPVLPFLRRYWGERFITVFTVFGVLAQFMFIAEYKDPVAFPVFYVTCGMFLFRRIENLWRPKDTHSRFAGRSIFKGSNAYSFKEPFFVAMTGVACLTFSEGLGTYLLIASVGLVVSHAYFKMRIASQARGARDARIEAQILRDNIGR